MIDDAKASGRYYDLPEQGLAFCQGHRSQVIAARIEEIEYVEQDGNLGIRFADICLALQVDTLLQ